MYTKCSLLLTLATLLTSSVFGDKGNKIHVNVNVDEYHTCIPLAFRPPNTTLPSQCIQLFAETLTATLHHIIPLNTLTTFINLALSVNPLENGLGAYLAISVRGIYRYFEENASAGAFPSLSGPQNLNPTVSFLHGDVPITFGGRNVSFDVDHRMLAAFTWIPGNLFYGPPTSKIVKYEPGDHLKASATRIVGSEAFEVLRRLYDNMQEYINKPNKRTATNYHTIIADLITVASARSRPYAFDPDDWVEAGVNNEGKLYDIKLNVIIKEVTIHGDKREELRKRSAGDSDVAEEDYFQATELVCEEYLKHMKPKFNTNFTHVDIDDDVVPLLVYSIENRHFVYGINEKTHFWFIKTLDQYGRVGKVTDEGQCWYYYDIQIHYEINGKHYFFGHDLKTKVWVIQLLTADGKIGRESPQGIFDFIYKTMFYMSINDQHYLYGQTDTDKSWFLRKLNADGTMGPEVSTGKWDHFYNRLFTFKIGNDQYIAGHNTNSKEHFIRDVKADNVNSMGKPNVWSALDRSYSVFFPFSLAGKTYFFGHDPKSKHMFIRRVFDNTFVEQKDIDFEFIHARPFNINGYQYFYAKLKGSSHWCRFHFDFNYFDD